MTTSATAAPRTFHHSILAAALGSPSEAAVALARGITVTGLFTPTKSALLIALGLVATIGVCLAAVLPNAAQPPKGEPKVAAEKPAEPVANLLGAAPFRAGSPIGDARYAAGGKRIVGYAGSRLHVWDANDGSLLRTLDTKLGYLDDPTRFRETGLAFAVHPKENRVACGGVKDGKTYLQLWDFETGKLLNETVGRCDALKLLTWTPNGERLLERSNVGWDKPTAWVLVVHDANLQELRTHQLPDKFGEWSTVMLALPGSKQVLLRQADREPIVVDLESGAVVRTIPHTVRIPSGLALSPDGKTLIATGTESLELLKWPTGELQKQLPVLRGGWEKPRPLFAPDGKTVYVWDHRPVAYDVATGREKWGAVFRTVHTVRTQLCDVSPDGATVLVRHGHGLSPLDAKTGTERHPEQPPSTPTGLVWSPDGGKVFTRKTNHDRTWTAWDAATGKRLYDLRPDGFVTGDDWKMLPDLFFLAGGREVVACVERSEMTERIGPKEVLVFDMATGRCTRRIGKPLPDTQKLFRWMHPIGVDPSGTTVLMQAFAVSALPAAPGAPAMVDTSREHTYKNIRWDPVKQKVLQEWVVTGNRFDTPRHFAPYSVTVGSAHPVFNPRAPKPDPARIRLYSLDDGKLLHELRTDHTTADLDRVQGNLLLASGYDNQWVTSGFRQFYKPQPPFAYDLWDIPNRAKLRLFEVEKYAEVALGPNGRYVLRVVDDATFEVYEPFVLKKVVAKVATTSRPETFEFSPDGRRVAVSFADASIAFWDAVAWRKQVEELVAGSVPTDLTPLWDDLAKDTATGFRAARLLSAAGDKAVTLLEERIEPKKSPDKALLKQWLTDLDSPAFATREKAEKNLWAIAAQAESHLREELKATTSPEVRKRVRGLLEGLDSRTLTTDETRELRAVQALEWLDTESARTLLARWAGGDPNATLTKAAVKAPGRR
jgi:WD40 repeat protein